MRRRGLIGVVVGAAAGWPLAARAQQPAMPIIGFLALSSPAPESRTVAALLEGLAQAGYVAGQNVAIEFRWVNFQTSLLPQLAAELVARQVAVIVTEGSPYAALAAMAATSIIPVVFVITEDPIKYGLVAGLNRPSANVTGMTSLATDLVAKRLSLLLELVPRVTKVGYLSAPSDSPVFEALKSEMLAAGSALGRRSLCRKSAISTSTRPSRPLSSKELARSWSVTSLCSDATHATSTEYWS